MLSSSLCPLSCFILRFALHNSANGTVSPSRNALLVEFTSIYKLLEAS